jgi:hypothetical protein
MPPIVYVPMFPWKYFSFTKWERCEEIEILQVLLLYNINMGLSFLAIFNDFWRNTIYRLLLSASESKHFFWVMIFFFPLGDPKKVGPVIVQYYFFEKIGPKLPYFEGSFFKLSYLDDKVCHRF